MAYEAEYVTDWSGSWQKSHRAFRQMKQFEGSFRFAVDEHARKLSATNKQLAAFGISVIHEDLSSGFSVLSSDISKVEDAVTGVRNSMRRGFEDLSTELRAGFAETLRALGLIYGGIEKLIALLESPSATWAYEQGRWAQDQVRRRLFPEALQSLERAINGHGSNVGLSSEYRFYLLQGLIRSGAFDECPPELVDQELAEKSFLKAVRYAEMDYPGEAGDAAVRAGLSAEQLGKNDAAIAHIRKGVELLSREYEILNSHAATSKQASLQHWTVMLDGMPMSESTCPWPLYHLGRLLWSRGATDKGPEYLFTAMVLKPDLSVVASGDRDLLANREQLEDVQRRARDRWTTRYSEYYAKFDSARERAQRFRFENFDAKTVLGPELNALSATGDFAKENANSGTVIGAFLAWQAIFNTKLQFAEFFADFRKRCILQVECSINTINEKASCERAPLSSEHQSIDGKRGSAQLLWAAIVGAMCLIDVVQKFTARSYSAFFDGLGSLVAAPVIVFVVVVIVGAIHKNRKNVLETQLAQFREATTRLLMEPTRQKEALNAMAPVVFWE